MLQVNLTGRIVAGDAQRFRRLIAPQLRAGYRLDEVRISSPGGLVDEAMAIGEEIAALEAATPAPTLAPEDLEPSCMIPAGASGSKKASYFDIDGGECTCMSACFLIWAGGVTRHGDVIGIHRPAFANAAYVPTHVLRGWELASRREVTGYLLRHGIPPAIVNRMYTTPTSSIYFLEEGELARLR
ncbi:hypothetical protein J2R96_005828 [Bradyrhizobium elkanii]|nr:hypothetical protein [Bradyrhizobium elkanii]